MMPARGRPVRKCTLALAARTGLALLCALSLSACVRPLLSPEDSRTPFDAYDAVRGQQVPQRVTNEFGRDQVNLRQRLAPKE